MPIAPWLLPALKAVLPHVGDLISATTPVFTRKRVGGPNDGVMLLQQQIDELQAAATANAEHIHELAEQLQRTVTAMEQAAELAQRRLRAAVITAASAGALALVALAVAVTAWLAR